MLFNSFEFLLLFLPITLGGFFLIGKRFGTRPAIIWLLLASLAYYAAWRPAFLWIPLLSIAFNYSLAWAIGRAQLKSSNAWSRHALTIGILGNVLLLLYHKAAVARLFEGVNQMTAAFSTEEKIILPLAISFITFQQIAYLVDTYRGKTRKGGLLEYSLFILFFPQLVMGPIVHYRELAPQFARPGFTAPKAENLAMGWAIFVVGLFKKTVLADSIGPYVDAVFAATADGMVPHIADAWLAALSFSFQIYFDFSGYADMAIGLARMFNISLPINFDSPFRAVDRFDFWRRWHVSFVSFMRQYVFFPLVRNRVIRLSPGVALIITVLLSGIWHGLGATFFLWSVAQGFMMYLLHLRRRFLARASGSGRLRIRPPRWGRIASCFLVTAVLGVMFRARDMDTALLLYGSMAGVHLDSGTGGHCIEGALSWNLGQVVWCLKVATFGKRELVILSLLAVVVWILPSTQTLFRHYWSALDQRSSPPPWAPGLVPGLERWLMFRPSYLWAVLTTVMLVIAILFIDDTTRFIYYQF